jgi:cytochrome c556
MIRTVLAVATTAAIALSVCVAVAQEDPIKARKALMKTNGDQAKIGNAMAKGEQPFDAAAVHKMFAAFQDAAAKMPALYPDNTKGGDPTDEFNAAPKVWEDMADFKAKFVKFGEDAKAADAKVTDAESLKTALGDIGKGDCGGCHKDYRLKKS